MKSQPRGILAYRQPATIKNADIAVHMDESNSRRVESAFNSGPENSVEQKPILAKPFPGL